MLKPIQQRGNFLACRGITSNGILLVFYCSPLTALLQVFRTRSSSSLHLPLSIMTILNGSLWVGYGLVRMHALGPGPMVMNALSGP